jgi:hypothetical protein
MSGPFIHSFIRPGLRTTCFVSGATALIFTAVQSAAHRWLYGPGPADVPEAAASGLVVVADGVGGLDLCATGLKYAAAWSGSGLRVETLHWCHGRWRWHADLTDTARHDEQARALADRIRDWSDAHPDRPVALVAKSGGSIVMVRALEALETGSVSAAVLLAPALRPEYDLSRALRAVQGELVVHHSPLDVIILGLGTQLFGTADRAFTPAAGLTGFRRPPGADPSSYARLRQKRWRPSMARCAYLGGHLGVDNPWFLLRHVLPVIAPGASGNRCGPS